jgi:hypothetical protein
MKKMILTLVMILPCLSFAGGQTDPKYLCGKDVTSTFDYEKWGSKWGLDQASYSELNDQVFLDAYELSVEFGNNEIAVAGRYELLKASIDGIGPVSVYTSDYVAPETKDKIEQKPYNIGYLRSRFIKNQIDLGEDDSPRFLYDYCIDENKLAELNCSGDKSKPSLEQVQVKEIICKRGCVDGACIAPDIGGGSGSTGSNKGNKGQGKGRSK